VGKKKRRGGVGQEKNANNQRSKVQKCARKQHRGSGKGRCARGKKN